MRIWWPVFAPAARHSNPWTGGEAQVRFVPGLGLEGAAETLWAATWFNAALLEGAAVGRFGGWSW
jgi:hypothetical protein